MGRGAVPRTFILAAALIAVLGACAAPVDRGPAVAPSAGPVYDSTSNPFAGRTLYAGDDLQGSTWAQKNSATGWLEPLLTTPQARWVNGPTDLTSLARASRLAAARRQLLVAVAYAVPNRGCDHYREGVADAAAYRRYVGGMVKALGSTPAVVVLEPDAVAADCWDAARGRMLTQAVTTLVRAGHHVYLDAGHAGWRSSGLMASRLIDAGITHASGFALNVSARDSVADARAYGEELSDLVGSRPYIVDTSRNGLGKASDDGRQTSWCNPPRQALGPRPSTTAVGHDLALLWIKNPGESDGKGPTCGGETAYPGLFSPRQARALLAGATWLTPAQRRALPPAASLPWTH